MTPDGASHDVPEITATELKARLDRDQPLVLVDVREPFEREIADLPEVGQKRIPIADLGDRADELDPDENLVLYCRSGSRSRRGTELLLERGYGKVFNLKGGVLAWREQVDPSLRAY